MQSFNCTSCKRVTYFENSLCLGCGAALGFDADALTIKALSATDEDADLLVELTSDGGGKRVRRCANADHGACNWLAGPEEPSGLCRACTLNRAIPDLSEPSQLAAWREVEAAKKRLVYSLLRFGLPIDGRAPDVAPLTFDVVKNAATGHLDGVITIDIAEADTVERERRRAHFDELYRTLLGHLRHESAHYYWPIVVEQAGLVQPFRTLFGDERADYGQAVALHHANGPPSDWQSTFVSAYATAHPWEDWAETWAHYLHMLDLLETAASYQASVTVPDPHAATRHQVTDPFATDRPDFQDMVRQWVPLTLLLNSLNRSLGQHDAYPFALSSGAMVKLRFVHDLVQTQSPQAVAGLPSVAQ